MDGKLTLFNLEGAAPWLKSEKQTERQYGGIAQLGEHLLCKQGVIGSIPIISTNMGAHSSAG